MNVIQRLMKSETWTGHKLQGRMKINGLNISIENKKGSIRRGVDKDGHEWSVKMNYSYGRIRSSIGADGDLLDVYIGPDKNSRRVFIVHQNDPTTGKYDEDKVMLFFPTPEDAKKAYLSQYDRPGFFGEMDETDIDTFKEHALSKKNHGKRLVIRRSINPELEVGIKVEMEHTDDPKEAKKIALDHLKEDPKYYSKLIAAGLVDEKDALDEAKRQGLKKSFDGEVDKKFYAAFKALFGDDEGRLYSGRNGHKLKELEGFPKEVSLENCDIIRLGKDVIYFAVGGDWQQSINVGVGMRDGKLKVVSVFENVNRQKISDMKQVKVAAGIQKSNVQKKTVAIDFDGVINSYTSGWKGAGETDKPVKGAGDGIKSLIDAGFTVIIFSTRANSKLGKQTIRQYLSELDIPEGIEITDRKPIADAYLDDRAVTFNGDWGSALENLKNFKPWMQKSREWQNHKYIKKIGNKYFYTEEEIRNFKLQKRSDGFYYMDETKITNDPAKARQFEEKVREHKSVEKRVQVGEKVQIKTDHRGSVGRGIVGFVKELGDGYARVEDAVGRMFRVPTEALVFARSQQEDGATLIKSVVWGLRKSGDGKHHLVPKRIIVSTKDGKTFSTTRHVNPDKKKVVAVVSAKEKPSTEEQAELWLKIGEKNRKRDYFKFCSTPKILETAGLKAGEPIVIHTDKLDTVMKEEQEGKSGRHGLTAMQLMDVQAGIFNPVAIIKTHDEKKKDRVIVLTDVMDDKGRPINAVIEPYCAKHNGKDAHMMFSVYGREKLDGFLEACRSHNSFIFKNEKRIKALTGDNKEQFQKSSPGLSSLHRDYNYFPEDDKRSVRYVVQMLEKSRKSPKLIPQKRMVTRDGKTFQTTVWVLPGEETGPVQGGFDFDVEPERQKKEPVVMDEEQYLARNGASRQDIGDPALHKNKGRNSDKAWRKIVARQVEKDRELIVKRAELRAEFREKVANGEIREKTALERRVETANGHPDNDATHAARRLLEKHGYDWKTGKKKEPEAPRRNLAEDLDDILEVAYKMARPKTKEGFLGSIAERIGHDKELQAEFAKRFNIDTGLPGADRKAQILERISDEFGKQKASHKERSRKYRQSKEAEKKATTSRAMTAIEALAMESENAMQEQIKQRDESDKILPGEQMPRKDLEAFKRRMDKEAEDRAEWHRTHKDPPKVIDPEWSTLDGQDVLRIEGSKFVAAPITGKKNASRYVVFNIDERKELAQISNRDVNRWLRKQYENEIENREVEAPVDSDSETEKKYDELYEKNKSWMPTRINDADYEAFKALGAVKKAELAKKAFMDGTFDEAFKRVTQVSDNSLVGQYGKKEYKSGWSSIKSAVKWFIENRLDEMAKESQTGSVFQKPFAMKYGGHQAMSAARKAAAGKGKSDSSSSSQENTGIDLSGEVWSNGPGRVQWDSPIGMITLEKGHFVSDPVKIGISVSEAGNALISHAKKQGII